MPEDIPQITKASGATLALLRRELMGDTPSAISTRAALGVAAVEAITKAVLRVRPIPSSDGPIGPEAPDIDIMFDVHFFKGDRQPVLHSVRVRCDA